MWFILCGFRAWPKISHEQPTIYGISTPGFQSHNIQVHAWEVGKYKSDILTIHIWVLMSYSHYCDTAKYSGLQK